VRVQSQRPRVKSFILASTYELEKLTAQVGNQAGQDYRTRAHAAQDGIILGLPTLAATSPHLAAAPPATRPRSSVLHTQTHPDHAAAAAITVHFGQHIAKDIAQREKHGARVKGQRQPEQR